MCKDYGHHFIVYRKDGREHARRYLTGLMGTQRRTVSRFILTR